MSAGSVNSVNFGEPNHEPSREVQHKETDEVTPLAIAGITGFCSVIFLIGACYLISYYRAYRLRKKRAEETRRRHADLAAVMPRRNAIAGTPPGLWEAQLGHWRSSHGDRVDLEAGINIPRRHSVSPRSSPPPEWTSIDLGEKATGSKKRASNNSSVLSHDDENPHDDPQSSLIIETAQAMKISNVRGSPEPVVIGAAKKTGVDGKPTSTQQNDSTRNLTGRKNLAKEEPIEEDVNENEAV